MRLDALRSSLFPSFMSVSLFYHFLLLFSFLLFLYLTSLAFTTTASLPLTGFSYWLSQEAWTHKVNYSLLACRSPFAILLCLSVYNTYLPLSPSLSLAFHIQLAPSTPFALSLTGYTSVRSHESKNHEVKYFLLSCLSIFHISLHVFPPSATHIPISP